MTDDERPLPSSGTAGPEPRPVDRSRGGAGDSSDDGFGGGRSAGHLEGHDAEAPEPETPLDPSEAAREAALAALGRARAAAKAKGLRPGMRPAKRRRRPDEAAYTGARVDTVGGRDPSLLGEQLQHLLAQRGWQTEVAVGSVMGRWGQIVGADIAAHTEPLTYQDGVLTVRTSSTAWATTLRLQSSMLIGRLNDEIGPDAVTELRFVGPNAPSWKRGYRSATDGRGPRDTYG